MKKFFNLLLCLSLFLLNVRIEVCSAQAIEPVLPPVGKILSYSENINPPVLQGMIVHPQEPFQFDFILDQGDFAGRSQSATTISSESEKLVKYFLASLTIPQEDLWVNLSPQERDRIVPEAFGQTQMGRDLLAQDYLLKQLTASLIYPEMETGKQFWNQIYQTIYKQNPEDLNNLEVNMEELFNSGKVWIVPDTAEVYVEGNLVVILKSRLKVMMEEEYFSARAEKSGQWPVVSDQGNVPHLNSNSSSKDVRTRTTDHRALTTNIIKQIILPVLEREVNEGTHFAPLRQIYQSMILASWFKQNLYESFLNQKYANQKKISGVNIADKQEKYKIFDQYVASFKKGVFNFIREDYDPLTQEIIPRRYVAGGLGFTDFALAVTQDREKYEAWYKNFELGGRALMRLQGAYQDAAQPPQVDDHAMTVGLSMLQSPYMKGLFDRFPFMRERLEGLLTMNHPLKEEALKEMEGMTGEEIFQIINERIQLHEDGKGMGFPLNSIEDTFYQITIGAGPDVAQVWRGVDYFRSAEEIEGMKRFFDDDRIKESLRKAYAPLFAFKYMYEEDNLYFPEEMMDFLLKEYLDDGMLYEMREFEGMKYALSSRLQLFVFLLLENLIKEDPRQRSIEELRPSVEEAWQNPEREAERQSIISFLTILEELKKRSQEWKDVLEEDVFTKASADEFAMIHLSQERLDMLREVSDFAMPVNPDGLIDEEMETIINLPDEVFFPLKLHGLMEQIAQSQGGFFKGVKKIEGDSREILDYLKKEIAAKRLSPKDTIAIRFELLVGGHYMRMGMLADTVQTIQSLLGQESLKDPRNVWNELGYFLSFKLQYFENLTVEYLNFSPKIGGLNLQGQGLGKEVILNLQEALKEIIHGKKIYLKDVTSIVSAYLESHYLGAVFYDEKDLLDQPEGLSQSSLPEMIKDINEQAERNVVFNKIKDFVKGHEYEDVFIDMINDMFNSDFENVKDPDEHFVEGIKLVIAPLVGIEIFADAIALKDNDAAFLQKEAKRLYMKNYMRNTGKFFLVAKIPGVNLSKPEDIAMAVKPPELFNPSFPANVYNALDAPHMREVVESLEEILQEMPEHFLTKALSESFQGTDKRLSYQEHLQLLERLGNQADLDGKAVYMPFGGYDVLTPFRLVQGSEDVYAVGLDEFGNYAEVFQQLFNAEALKSFLGSFRSFDYISQYVELERIFGTKGLGGLAVLRVLAWIQGDIQRISYFDIDDQGELYFLNESDVLKGKGKRNAVIEFVDPKDNQMKRFWYISRDLMKDDSAYEKFINHLKFQALVIKAPFVQTGYWQDSFAPRIFNPAKNNHAKVFHDQVSIGHKYPHGIWKPNFNPERIPLNEKETIGYSNSYVYHGEAKDLRDKPLTFGPKDYNPQRVYMVDLAWRLVKRFDDHYEDQEDLMDVLENVVEEFETLDEKIASIWADFSFSRVPIERISGDRRMILDDILAILSKTDEDRDARLFAWRIGQIAYENTLKQTWKHNEPMLLDMDQKMDGGVFLDLASGPRVTRTFKNLNSKNKYIYVDRRYEMEGFINRAIEEYGAYDYIEFRRVDLTQLQKVFRNGEQYDMISCNDIDSYVPNLGKSFVETLMRRVKPEGKILVSYNELITADSERWLLPLLGPLVDHSTQWGRQYFETTWGRTQNDITVNLFDKRPDASQQNGGIDLNPDRLDLKAKGDSINFSLPEGNGPLLRGNFPGLVPVIYSITPIYNLPLFLGRNFSQEPKLTYNR